ncbi:MAG: glycosyltransferase [Planctomycetaceae bacterium]
MSRPWLSVVMPTYNGERYVLSALTSLERAGVAAEDVEVIAVDDGSTDATLAILEHFRSRLPLTVLAQEHSGNWTSSTNRGMALASGEYLCWLHQDDQWHPGRLQRMRELIDQEPDAVWYFHPSRFIGPDGRELGTWRCPFGSRASRRECESRSDSPTIRLSPDAVWSKLLVQCFVATCAPVFSARVLRDVGPLDESLWYSADWDFWLRLSRLGVGVYDPAPWSSFRIHPESQTSLRTRDTTEFEGQQRLVLARHLETWRHHERAEFVGRMGGLSVTLNSALAVAAAGGRADWRSVWRESWRVRPWRWPEFLRDSGIWDRVQSRRRMRQECAKRVSRETSQAESQTPQPMSKTHGFTMVLPSSG